MWSFDGADNLEIFSKILILLGRNKEYLDELESIKFFSTILCVRCPKT